MKYKVDISGMKFGRLTVLDYIDRGYWALVCDCGGLIQAHAYSLKNNSTVSCGCYHKEMMVARATRHGLSTTRAYKSWEAMMDRCYNKDSKDYQCYGGRGIKVCKRWHNVQNFFSDMGERPDGYSIDRLNPNLNYCLSNCRWATRLEQGVNKRNARLIEHEGLTLHLAEWARRLKTPANTLRNRINAGRSLTDKQRERRA